MENEQVVRVARVGLRADGIVRVMQYPDVDLTLEDAHEVIADYLKVRQGKRRPILIDARKMRSFARDARQLFASDDASRDVCAFAMIVDTPLSRVLGSFCLGFSNPALQTWLFTFEEEALAWLKGYLE